MQFVPQSLIGRKQTTNQKSWSLRDSPLQENHVAAEPSQVLERLDDLDHESNQNL